MIVVNSHKIFGEDWFMHTCAQGVNAGTCDEIYMCVVLPYVCVCMH